MSRIYNVLSIAGTDPSGGAGIQADIKTFSALGTYATTVITSLVAQNTRGVQSVYPISAEYVAAQLDSVLSDVRIDSAKIGQLQMARVERVQDKAGVGALRTDQQRRPPWAVMRTARGKGVDIARLYLVLFVTPQELQRRNRTQAAAGKDISHRTSGLCRSPSWL